MVFPSLTDLTGGSVSIITCGADTTFTAGQATGGAIGVGVLATFLSSKYTRKRALEGKAPIIGFF